MIDYVEAPDTCEPELQPFSSLFLAGGITGCSDWQAELVQMLRDARKSIMVFNPRRANFPIHDPAAAYAQIEWEFKHLRKATAISFWFPPETLCPIALYELGAQAALSKTLFVGVHPDYQRKTDVIVQLRLVRPRLEVVFSLSELAAQVCKWAD
jgi:hypothetical protein